MKKTLATVACALTVITALSVAAGNTRLGMFGVDAVSAATGTAEAAKPAATAKPTTVETASAVKRLLAFGSYGGDVKLVQTWLNSNGYNLAVDGILGKLTEAAVKDYQGKHALKVDGIVGPRTLAKLTPAPAPVATTPAVTTPVATAPTTPTTSTTPAVGQTTIKIGRVEAAAHGTKCFTVAVAAVAGDKIVAVSVDDYQFVNPAQGFKGVPNSDKDFGKNYPSGLVLASKRTNTDPYSKNMMSEGATQTWMTNMVAVEKFAEGKTIAELEAAIKANRNADGTDKDATVDAVTGATFVNTNGYLDAVLAAAKNAKENTSVTVDSSALSSIKIGRVEAAAHGTKCFTVAVAVTAGDKVVADSVDDYQFVNPAQGFKGVPNSDKDFGKNYPAGLVLASKETNTEPYSKNMMSEGATLPWITNMTVVEKFATGKTISELEAAISSNKNADGTDKDATVDAVTGATFVNTNGYLQAVLDAAKAAK